MRYFDKSVSVSYIYLVAPILDLPYESTKPSTSGSGSGHRATEQTVEFTDFPPDATNADENDTSNQVRI